MPSSSETPAAMDSEGSLREREQQIPSAKLRTAYKRARLQLVKTIEGLERDKESSSKTSELVNLILRRTAARIADRPPAKGASKPERATTIPAQLLKANGGAYKAAEVAALLGDITRQAVFTRRQQNQLLGLQLP